MQEENKKLRDEVAWLRFTMAAAGLGTWEWNIASGKTAWSEQVEPILGLQPGTFSGTLQDFIDLLPASEMERMAEALKSLIEHPDETAWSIDCWLHHPDGSVHWLECKGRLDRNEYGAPIRMAGSVRDVTKRKLAEQAFLKSEARLRESEERFRALIEKSSDIVGVLNRDATLRMVSPSIEEHLGYQPEQLLNTSALALCHPDDRPWLAKVYQEILEMPGTTRQINVRLRHKDGSWRTFEAAGRNLFHVAAVQGVIINARDTTERKRLEEQLLQAQKMESIGRLAGGIAHDFNNLLTAISGYIELARMQMPPKHPPRHHLDLALHGVERASTLTAQLLAFARKQIIEPRVIQLNERIAAMGQLLRRLIGENIVLTTELDPALWLVKVDPSQFEQIVVNLAVNARDAMPQGGRLLIKTCNVSLAPGHASPHVDLHPGDYVRLSIQDTGSGISPESQERIFEPFFTTKEPGKGSGLGLATCHGIVKQSGGHIRFTTADGNGTTFEIFLPRTPVEAQPEALPPASLPTTHGRETLLLVEDEPMVREIAAQVLGAFGYFVLEAAGGEQALELARDYGGKIHLLLTDVVMPGMSGKEVADSVSRLRPGIKTLYTSGYTEDAIVQYGILDPNVYFLPKPYNPTTLSRKVREVLDAAG